MEIGQSSLNPLKRVNSILTIREIYNLLGFKYHVSIPSNGSIQFLLEKGWFPAVRSNGTCLNPLKRVNSILTEAWIEKATEHLIVSIPSNGSIQFLPY